MKRRILKFIVQVIYRFAEHTPSEVKKSKRNILVAKAALSVDELVNNI